MRDKQIISSNFSFVISKTVLVDPIFTFSGCKNNHSYFNQKIMISTIIFEIRILGTDI